MRVGVGQGSLQTFAAEQYDEAVAFPGLDNDCAYADFFTLRGQQRAQFLTHGSFDPPRLGDRSRFLCIEGAEVGARGDVASAQFESETECFDNAAANLKLQRIVAEETQVTRSATGRNAGCHWYHSTLAESWRARRGLGSRRLQRCHITLVACGDVTQPSMTTKASLAFVLSVSSE